MKFAVAEWRLAFEIAWDDPWFKIQTIVTSLVVLLSAAMYLWRLIPSGVLHGSLVFHYNVYLGIDDVRTWPWVFYLPLVMMGIVGIDLAASCLVYRYDKIASRVLLTVASVFALLMAVGELFIVLING